ncbi:TPA: hypothetical protein L9M71_000040 [Klebsiella quasipneumoniae subsp. similipneumoniae]|nr:hypothetical protein [Klebsiella quasipneumoniae subsp. similipneumoniae]
MTSKLTREERVQSLYGLKIGQVLNPSDIESIKMLARMALAAMDGEPVAYTDERNLGYIDRGRETAYLWGKHNSEASDVALYAVPQPAPVVPDDVLDALQKVARIRLDMNDFDGDRRGIADCLCDAEEALIEVVNRRAAMLAAAPQEVKGE